MNLFLRFFYSCFFAVFIGGFFILALEKILPGVNRLFFLFFAAFATAGAFSWLNYAQTGPRLKKAAHLLSRMGEGDFSPAPAPKGDDEVGGIESAISRTSSALSAKLNSLEEEKGKREAVLASMGEGVIVTDLEGNISLFNKKAAELFGRQLSGKRLMEATRDPKLLDLIPGIRDRWETVSVEMTLPPGGEKALLVTVAPFIRKLSITGSVIVFHDITTLRKLEKMRKDFVANVSHELKTPLTSIRGFAETLSGGGLEDAENAPRFVETIKRNSERLSRLVEDLLTLSNIELGKIAFDVRVLSLADPAGSVAATLGQKAAGKGIELKVDIPGHIAVRADRDRLEQVLMNLVDNGIKFTEKGSVAVSAKITGEKAEISVEDTGIGIPAKDLERLGERFYRVDPARSRELGGTGLGLAIVKHLVTAMGGSFSVKSREGEGTAVTFTLPAS